MRRGILVVATGGAIVGAFVGCAQEEQELPFDVQDEAPVVRAVPSSGDMTISTASGLSMTLPEGAVPEGTGVAVAGIKPEAIAGGPAPAGSQLYLIGFAEPPRKDPVLTVATSLEGTLTAGELVGMVPVVLRLAPGGSASLASVVPAARAFRPAGGQESSALEKLGRLKALGVFDGVDLGGTTQDFELDGHGAIQKLLDLIEGEVVPPGNSPPFTGLTGHWTRTLADLTDDARVMGFWGPRGAAGAVLGAMGAAFSPGGGFDPEELIEGVQGLDAWYVAYMTPTATIPVLRYFDWEDWSGGATYPLIPPGQTSATFTLVCTGIAWDPGIPRCGSEFLDVRASEKLLERFPAGVLAINYIGASATLEADGSASGRIEYDVAYRAALAAGVAAYRLEDALDLGGTWSAGGSTIQIAGRRYRFSTPDPNSVILMLEDSVRLKDGGTESWEKVQVHLKLVRQ